MKDRTEYTILLKDGTSIKLWFMGKQLEMILKDYNVPYVKKEGK